MESGELPTSDVSARMISMGSHGRTDSSAWAARLGRAVRTRRKQLRLTQIQLATMAGCGPVFIYDLESGQKKSLRLDKLIDVLNVLGLQLALEQGKSGFRVGEDLT